MLQAKNGFWHYWLWGTSSGTGVNTAIPVVANEWHHVAFTRLSGANSVNFYLDGRLVVIPNLAADGAGTGNIATSADPFAVGSTNINADFFAGQIDEVKLWNVFRTQANIQSDMKTYGGSLAD
jgi:hypothetical protein